MKEFKTGEIVIGWPGARAVVLEPKVDFDRVVVRWLEGPNKGKVTRPVRTSLKAWVKEEDE